MKERTHVDKYSIIQNNISSIQVGQNYTYKKLCELLKVPYRSGGTQKYNTLEIFSLFFSWEKRGTKYYIDKIYEISKPKPLKRPSKYTQHLEPVILSLLEEENPLYITPTELAIECGFINHHYLQYYYHRGSLVEELSNIIMPDTWKKNTESELDAFERAVNSYVRRLNMVHSFYNACRSHFLPNLKNSLKSMDKRHQIQLSEHNMITDGDKNEHIASDTEERDISAAKQLVFRTMKENEELKVSSIKELFYNYDESMKYYRRLSAYYYDNYGWNKVQKIYKLEKTHSIIVSKDEKKEAKKAIRQLSFDNCRKSKNEYWKNEWECMAELMISGDYTPKLEIPFDEIPRIEIDS